MSNLKTTIEDLASEFAARVLDALRTASINELTGFGGTGAVRRGGRGGARGAAVPAEPRAIGRRGRGGRLGRRSADDISRMVESIVSVLEKHPEGLRAEQIREQLAVQARELPRPLADALGAGRISKTGQKRATTYFAGDKPASGGGTSPKRRRSGGKKKRAA